MHLCKFGEIPPNGSKDIVSERSYADADADGICTKNNVPHLRSGGHTCTIRVVKTKVLISFAVTSKLICAFVFAYADFWFSHDVSKYSCICCCCLTTMARSLCALLSICYATWAICLIHKLVHIMLRILLS